MKGGKSKSKNNKVAPKKSKSKKSSKSKSKKSKKMTGGAKKSKSKSKTASKSKTVAPKKSKSKSRSKQAGGSKTKKGTPPHLVESNKFKQHIVAASGMKFGKGIMKFSSSFWQDAKKALGETKDYKKLKEKAIELFDKYMSKNGKKSVYDEIMKLHMEKKSKSKK